MAKEIISISAEAQTQVGATTFKQRPSSGYMEMWGLSTADNYQTWQRNMPLEDAESYAD